MCLFQCRGINLGKDEKGNKSEVHFAHESERQFAELLDFYGIRWQYQPKTFPLQWDEHGNLHEAFTPDFFLPEQELYIELTTMKQSLMTKKHRKLRHFQQLYPDIKIKLLNRKDYTALARKYKWEERIEKPQANR